MAKPMSDDERAKKYNAEQRAYEAGTPTAKQAAEMAKQAAESKTQQAQSKAYDKAVQGGYADGGSVSLEDRLEDARSAERRGRNPWLTKAAKVGHKWGDVGISMKDAEKAYDKLQNLREEEVETLAKRAGKDKDPYEDTRRGSARLLRFAKGGKVGGASKRGDGIAQRGKTKGRMV